MDLPALDNPYVVIGILALVLLELVKMMTLAKRRRVDMNGGNPVVKALDKLGKDIVLAVQVDGEKTRTRTTEVAAAAEKRQTEHQEREERWMERIHDRLEQRS